MSLIKGKNINLWALEKYNLLTNLKWVNDRELIRLTGMPSYPKSLREMEIWYHQAIKNPANKFFTIKTPKGLHIGNIELNSIDWINRSLEIGILIGERDYWGKGVGTEATLLMLDFIFLQMDFNRVYLNVSSHNKNAIKLYEKCGFKKEGLQKKAFYFNNNYHDVLEMNILKKEFLNIKNARFGELFENLNEKEIED